MEPVPNSVCNAKCKTMDERFSRDKHDIEEHESRIREIEELNIRFAKMLEMDRSDIEKHDMRINALEKRPAVWWDKVIAAVISVVVSALVSGLIGR